MLNVVPLIRLHASSTCGWSILFVSTTSWLGSGVVIGGERFALELRELASVCGGALATFTTFLISAEMAVSHGSIFFVLGPSPHVISEHCLCFGTSSARFWSWSDPRAHLHSKTRLAVVIVASSSSSSFSKIVSFAAAQSDRPDDSSPGAT